MPVLPIGAFERGLSAARRGFNRSGLGQALGQDSVQRRMFAPFGRGTTVGASSGPRRDFGGGGVLGDAWGSRSAFGGRGSSALGFTGFEDVSWDPATGLQRTGGTTGGGGGGSVGDPLIDAAALARGVPPAVLKALVNRESSGNWAANNYIADIGRRKPDGSPNRLLPYVGIFETTAASWGLDWNAMVGNQQAQLDGMATIIGGIKQQHGFADWGQAAAYYFGGPNSTNPGWTDENGMSVADYQAKFNADVAVYGGTGGGEQWGDGGTGSAIADTARQYVGVPYNWGVIPGATQNPWDTGWDCSGFVWFLDQKYGGKTLPQGSHYQYQWAQQSGNLYTDTSQLRAGDLMFFNTGNTAGGGAYLNSAGHVGIYIGNGQMIHAANEGADTIITNISDPYYQGRFLGAARMAWSGGGTTPAPSPAQGQQAANGAFYTPGYVIPARIPR